MILVIPRFTMASTLKFFVRYAMAAVTGEFVHASKFQYDPSTDAIADSEWLSKFEPKGTGTYTIEASDETLTTFALRYYQESPDEFKRPCIDDSNLFLQKVTIVKFHEFPAEQPHTETLKLHVKYYCTSKPECFESSTASKRGFLVYTMEEVYRIIRNLCGTLKDERVRAGAAGDVKILFVIDLDETIVENTFVKDADGRIIGSTSKCLEATYTSRAAAFSKEHPEVDTVLVTNTKKSRLKEKLNNAKLDEGLFTCIRPAVTNNGIVAKPTKKERVERLLDENQNKYGHVIILDDRFAGLKAQMEGVQKKGLPVTPIWFIRGIPHAIKADVSGSKDAHIRKGSQTSLEELWDLPEVKERVAKYNSMVEFHLNYKPKKLS